MNFLQGLLACKAPPPPARHPLPYPAFAPVGTHRINPLVSVLERIGNRLTRCIRWVAHIV